MLNINFFKPQGPFNLEDLTENALSNGGIKIFKSNLAKIYG